MHSLEPGETPSTTFLNLATNDEIMTKINLQYMERNRTGIGNIFNLIMRMAVIKKTMDSYSGNVNANLHISRKGCVK